MEGHVLLSTPQTEVRRVVPHRRRRESGWMARSELLRRRSQAPMELIDLTHELSAFAHRSGLREGWIGVQVLHTTAALALNENEPLLREDLLALLERLAPRGAGYEHDDLSRRRDLEEEERPNGHSHAKALMLRASETVHVVGGEPRLGRYQRLFLVELDGPRERDVSLMALGSR
jgi:secondary thiamine-phosphate synthase enzyme